MVLSFVLSNGFLYLSAGSLEDWDAAVQKTESRLNRVNEQRAKARSSDHVSLCENTSCHVAPLEFRE